ncbi:uncharacterized mitochondrial protein-like protein [Tanacetum coccineum]
MSINPIPTTRIHKDHPLDQVIGDLQSSTQTRRMSKNLRNNGLLVLFNKEQTIKTFKTACLLAFYHKKNPKRNKKMKEYTRLKKALYGLHQAPRAWYKDDILLVQVYVDDIIFGSTKKELCNAFEKLMHEKFQMSSIGELTFFLGLQVQQKKDSIFISHDKYVGEILKKFGFTEVKTASTPMETQNPLLKDEDSEEVDVHIYRSMIGSFMYLTSSRPDIMFAVRCFVLVFQSIKDFPFDSIAILTDSDYAWKQACDRKFSQEGGGLRRQEPMGEILLLKLECADMFDNQDDVDMFDVNTLTWCDEFIAEQEVANKIVNLNWMDLLGIVKLVCDAVCEITTALIDVNAAQLKLVPLENFNENYSKCLRLLVKLQLSVQSYYC